MIWRNVLSMMGTSGITAAELSRAIGKSDNYISQCIKADRNPTIDIVIDIADFFKVAPFDLIKDGTAKAYKRRYLEEEKARIEKELESIED